MRLPRKLELPLVLRAAPGILNFFDREVPGEFIAQDVGADGSPTIEVSCVCGETPILRFGMRAFSIEECSCGRFFLYDGRVVRAGRAPAEEDAPSAHS